MRCDLAADGRFGSILFVLTTRHGLYNSHHDVDAIWILAFPHDLAIVLEVTGDIPSPMATTGRVTGQEAALRELLSNVASIDVSSRSNVYRRESRVYFDDGVATLLDAHATALEDGAARLVNAMRAHVNLREYA